MSERRRSVKEEGEEREGGDIEDERSFKRWESLEGSSLESSLELFSNVFGVSNGERRRRRGKVAIPIPGEIVL